MIISFLRVKSLTYFATSYISFLRVKSLTYLATSYLASDSPSPGSACLLQQLLGLQAPVDYSVSHHQAPDHSVCAPICCSLKQFVISCLSLLYLSLKPSFFSLLPVFVVSIQRDDGEEHRRDFCVCRRSWNRL